MQPPRPRLAEADGTVTPAAFPGLEFRANLVKHGQTGRKGVVPLRKLFAPVAVSGFHVKIHEAFHIVIRFVRIQHGHEVVIAPAERAGAFQCALAEHEHIGMLFRRLERRAHTGSSRAEDEHVRLVQRAPIPFCDAHVYSFVKQCSGRDAQQYLFHKKQKTCRQDVFNNILIKQYDIFSFVFI